MIAGQLGQFTDIYGYFVIIFTLHACLVLEGYDIILVPASNNRNYRCSAGFVYLWKLGGSWNCKHIYYNSIYITLRAHSEPEGYIWRISDLLPT